ncbi:MAG: class I SAM-dependent methyltransferase [Deltaproteobacteria bacterium]|nr:class I SAM-dependent methyltransferase [Deltaproteobacteria bacterium]
MEPAYAERFATIADAETYDRVEYAAGSYASSIWALQRPFLARLVEGAGAPGGERALLDFACGTGRVLASVEGLATHAAGIDISPAMVELARRRCTRARLHVGDLVADPGLLPGPFDVITAFRFLLNVDPEVRLPVLAALRGRLRRPGGILIVNAHGNSRSMRHPAIAWKRLRRRLSPAPPPPGEMLAEMGPAETRDLLARAGLAVEAQHGFGVVPPTLYRTPLRGLARAIDGLAAARPLARSVSVDLLFVCRAA